MKHPHIVAAEIDLLREREREIEAKNAAETAMRHWAFCAARVGSIEGRLHALRRQWDKIPTNP